MPEQKFIQRYSAPRTVPCETKPQPSIAAAVRAHERERKNDKPEPKPQWWRAENEPLF